MTGFFRTFRDGHGAGTATILERWEQEPVESGVRFLSRTESIRWTRI